MKALMELGAKHSQLSSWSDQWDKPQLDSKSGFHMGKKDCKDHKDFWIEIDLKKPAEVSQIILKRRADNDNPDLQKEKYSMSERLIDNIKVEFNSGNDKWT